MQGVIPIPEDAEEDESKGYDYIWGDSADEDGSGEEWDPKEWGR